MFGCDFGKKKIKLSEEERDYLDEQNKEWMSCLEEYIKLHSKEGKLEIEQFRFLMGKCNYSFVEIMQTLQFINTGLEGK